MLLTNFFKILHVESSEKHRIDVELNAEHPIYKGHFPGTPVMPGVCLTQMVKESVEHITGKRLQMVTGDNLKFTAVLDPTVYPKVQITLSLKDKENGLLQADSLVSSGEINFFTFKGSFRDE